MQNQNQISSRTAEYVGSLVTPIDVWGNSATQRHVTNGSARECLVKRWCCDVEIDTILEGHGDSADEVERQSLALGVVDDLPSRWGCPERINNGGGVLEQCGRGAPRR